MVSRTKGGIFKPGAPKFYGSTTVGERGQVVIPAEVRRDFEMTPNTKLLVFGSPGHGGIMLTKAETVSKLITRATEMLERLETLQKLVKEEGKTSGSN
jgi:AbrB family looped-hinge helix DNA binding protein